MRSSPNKQWFPGKIVTLLVFIVFLLIFVKLAPKAPKFLDLDYGFWITLGGRGPGLGLRKDYARGGVKIVKYWIT